MIAVAKNGIRCVALARDHHKALVVAEIDNIDIVPCVVVLQRLNSICQTGRYGTGCLLHARPRRSFYCKLAGHLQSLLHADVVSLQGVDLCNGDDNEKK